MHALPSLLRQLALTILLIPCCAALAAEDEGRVGFVNKVENEASVVSAEGDTRAVIGTAVHMKDELRTGENGRLQVTFRDNTQLTLGEKASVVVDRYVYDPEQSVGETVLQATRGAFRFASGKIKDLKTRSISVSTPVADIGIRGTEFWGGQLDKYGVVLLEGEITVANQAGSVTLSTPGQGTDIPSPLDPPGVPTAWPADKVARAIDTVTLH